MQHTVLKHLTALSIGALVAFSSQAAAQSATTDTNSKEHKHAHKHDHQKAEPKLIDESKVLPRALSDWENDWQSVYPFLKDGTLDPVLEHKAESGKKTAEEYRTYYETGFKTDVDRIQIDGANVAFFKDGKPVQGEYESDGYEILTYKSGNQGIRFIYEKSGGDTAAPQFIQFSDHEMVPTKVDHFHLYWGDDRAALLKEVTNWPTYFPAAWSGADIVESMTSH
ncbi:ZinT family metal-binding protein [Shimia sagamensis]|uniref:Zinc transport system substrate-binding protein n=1 Tax=Shimia sagamensis TaxID=1566352 RepID=A0ABY1P0B5_9RHOB|nr:ZinT/AdcA family metal-binding protein [Shimia sagamensis]SMP22933.1 zinc transport system substrate-binding protein [Shimia sagamensis]